MIASKEQERCLISTIMVDFAVMGQGSFVTNLHPEQCRAARGLLNWTQEQLAALAGVSRSTIKDFECHRHALHRATETLLVEALEKGGVRLLYSGKEGPGVRLKAPLSLQPSAAGLNIGMLGAAIIPAEKPRRHR
ncbi:helix-turn-helix domain-containing protein [Inquilinus sp. CAU 1745]|uniref:helix-turn-helix transcriptional regulator n=1 Tax=Inquilinus sp. CAU 1745 TaxID=3140369 RepID=UPI00325B8C37